MTQAVPLAPIHALPIAPPITREHLACISWAIVLFGLTSPFAFLLTGEDPTIGVPIDPLSYRRPDLAQLNLYLLRFTMVAAALALSLRSLVHARSTLRRLLPLLPFLAWAALTLFWTDAPTSTRNALVALAALLLATGLAATRLSLEQLARAFIYSIAISAVLSLVTVIVAPQLGIHQPDDASQAVHAGAWRGIHVHKNALGPLSGLFLAALLFAGRPLIGPAFKWSLIALLGLLVVMSRSALAFAIIAPAAAIGWIAVRPNATARLLGVVLLLLLGILGLLVGEALLDSLGRDITLTGRTGIWAVALEFITERPLTGFGFRSLSYGGFAYRAAIATGISDPHNGYVDLALGTGLVGILLLLVAAATAFRRAGNAVRHGPASCHAAQVFAAAFAGWLLSNLSETNMQALRTEGAIGFILLAILLLARASAQRAPINSPISAI